MILRSLLFVPADSEKKLAKASSSPVAFGLYRRHFSGRIEIGIN